MTGSRNDNAPEIKGQPPAPDEAEQRYAQLVDRNWGFLAPEEQARIGSLRVMLAGCGLGSNLAVLAARTGFRNFILYDGDNVEVSNLNRQAFRREHLGRNKAQATAALIREINPEARVVSFPVYLTAEDAAPAVRRCDLVVNMVDPGPALRALFTAARSQGKPLLFPMNVGFGGVLLAFGSESPSLEELLDPDDHDDLFIRMLLRLAPALPPYLQQYVWIADRVVRERIPPPQLGVAASQTAALLVTAMARIAGGHGVPCVPSVMFLDAREPSVAAWQVGQDHISALGDR